MKLFKKMMTFVLAAIMTVALGATSVFAENVNITVKDGDTHTYAVYQIFTGDFADGTLSNVKWGANGTGTTGESVAKTTLDEIEAINGTDAEKAAALSAYANLSGTAFATVSASQAASVPTGYYLIKDNDALAEDEEATLYIVQVVGPTEITRKAGTTSSDKKVDDVNDSDTETAADNGKLQTSSDYDIGDDVPYHVTATISSGAAYYSTYEITLEDILEDGKFDAITLDKTAIKLGEAAITETADYTVTTKWDTEPTKNGFKVTYTFVAKEGKTLAAIAGKTIAIDFTAKLGTGAAIGSAGNKNTLKVSFSNNPNTDEKGNAPDKEVITFTYKVVVDKFDEDGETPLENAGFTLYKVSKADAIAGVNGADAQAKNAAWTKKAIQTWTTTATEGATAGKNNRFSFNGIDDGYYVLCETTTPAGYNTMEPQVFKVTATHGGTDNTGLTLDTLNGDKVTGEITFTADKAAGSLSANVINQKGTTLPSTGGIGTTIFYVLGGLLVAGAGIVLVARKKASE